MKILIDPYVIALPPLHSSTDRVLRYVDGMETWINVASYPFLKVLYDSECFHHLLDADVFPFPQKLRQLFSSSGINQYDAYTAFTFATNIFRSWEDIRNILRILTITGHITVAPALFINRLSKGLSAALLDCLGKLIIQKHAGDPELSSIYIGSIDSISNISGELVIHATITNIQGDTNKFTFPATPTQIDTYLTLLLDFEDILNSIQWDIIWQYPTLAIEKAYYSVVQYGDRDTYSIGKYKVGDNFLHTIINHGFPTQPSRIKSTYVTCALVICGLASKVTGINPRPLRGKVRLCDNARGMRADISQYKAGYRLHYWKCGDSSIELSCINVHNDMSIY